MLDEAPFEIPNELISHAKTLVSRWFDLADERANWRTELLRGVDDIAQILPRRSDWYEVVTVALDRGVGIPIQLNEPQFKVFPCHDCLALSTIVPGWGYGWSTVWQDEDVYDTLSWFLHYSRQYIHRAYAAKLLMIVCEEHGEVLDLFGSRGMRQRYSDVMPLVSAGHALLTAKTNALAHWGSTRPLSFGSLTLSPWINRNTLDPYIHQAVFHFLRARKLVASEFALEAIVAFDCTIQSIASFLRARCGLPSEPSRSDVCMHLNLDNDSADLAEYIYFIRNNFGAHAGGWRWWNQDESINEEESLACIDNLASTILSEAADLEPEVRSIDPAPDEWGLWFFQNFEMLWDSVWFEKFDKWRAKA